MFTQVIDTLHQLSLNFISIAEKEILFSSLLFLIVSLLAWILKNQRPYLHYGLWTLVLLRLVLPTDFSLSVSARELLSKLPGIETVAHDQGFSSAAESKISASSAVAVEEILENKSSSELSSGSPTNSSWFEVVSWQLVLFCAWLLGMLVFAFIFVKRYFHYHRIAATAKEVNDPQIASMLNSWRQTLQIRRRVRLVYSDDCLSPFTIGVFRPVIYLPDLLLKSSLPTIESVVAHELAHIRNWDDLWIKLQNIVQLLYFFHPVVWLTNSQLNRLREKICDELVLSKGTISPKAYGSSMLSVLKMNLIGVEGVEMLPSFGNHKKKFSERIREITKITRLRKSNLLLSNLLLAALAIFLLPMSESSGGADDDGQIVRLKRWVNGEQNFFIHTVGAGSKFQSISVLKSKDVLCPTKLPDLCQIEFAAIGLYDNDYRRYWVMKGVDDNGATQLYLDADGDNCFSDEAPLKIKKKTAKYHLEDSPDWVMNKYLKSEAALPYQFSNTNQNQIGSFAVHLFYVPEKNFLEFDNNEFWMGEAWFGEQKYPIALYGGLMAGWYLRPTFDDPAAASQNEIRVDLNRNGVFEDMTIFDPTTETVAQERYFVNELFVVDGQYYKVDSISRMGDYLVVKILPQSNHELSKLNG
jgi:beta-lactamase regulating signal transducer with metallopeptidase domain